MAKYDPNITVEEALAPFVESLEKGKLTGKLVINSSTSRRSGTLFVSEGLVYAVQVKNYPSRLYTRLLSTGSLREDHVEDIEHRFERDQLNPDVISYATRSMMLSDIVAQSLLWEHNLGAWDDLFNWVGVKVEWKDGPTTSEATIWPHRNTLARFVHLGRLRREALIEIAQKYTVDVSKLAGLTYRTLQEGYDGENYEPMVMAYGTGDFSANDLVKMAGINLHDAISTIYELWIKDVVAVHYEGLRLSRKNIEMMKSDPLSYGEAQPLIHADEKGSVPEPDEALDAEFVENVESAPISDEAVAALLVENSAIEPEAAVSVPEDHEEAVQAAGVEADEDDFDFVDTLDPDDEAYEDEEEEQAQAEELHLVDAAAETQPEAVYEETFEDHLELEADDEEEEYEDESLPLAEDEPTTQPAETEAAATAEETAAEIEQPVATPVMQPQHEDDFTDLFERVKGKLATMRASTEEAASNMRACDDAIESDSGTITELEKTIEQLQAQIAAAQTAINEAQERIQENETTREQWEGVYDENAKSYHQLQERLAGLRNL